MLNVLFEDNHLLVVNKPAGLVTQGAAAAETSLVQQAKSYIKQKYAKPGNVYLGVVSRLDALATGVLVLARTSKAAARLNEQFRGRRVQKTYWVLIERELVPRSGSCEDHLRKDDLHRRMTTCPSTHPDGQLARLEYRSLENVTTAEDVQLLEILLETGRKHQIRVQLASRGFPVLGDHKYGSRQSFPGGIALHSRELRLEHPVRSDVMTFTADVPASWRRFLRGHS